MARREPEPEDLLDPSSKPTIEQLFRAIHAVNPTDRGLNAGETSRRYALKSRLQSLLIRRFGYALTVRADRDLVALHHASGDRDFGHVVLDQLDEEARRWVHQQTAPEAPEGVVPGTPAPAAVASRSALEEAREALESYDYDGARSQLEALHRAGSPEGTRLLVELLVDTLVDDEAAVALAISDDDDPAVRARVALAAARLGQAGRALRLLAGVSNALAADARVQLAKTALQAGRVDGAARLLTLARDGDPSAAEIGAVTAQLEAVRRARLGPLEAELAGRPSEELARQILEIDPEHVAARALLREQAAAERAQRLEQLLSTGNAALEAGDLQRAREAFAEARTRGGDVRAAVEEIGRRERAARIASVSAALVEDPDMGLARWLELDGDERLQISVDRPEIRWLSGVRAAGQRARDLVRAARVAGELEGTLAGGAEVAERLLDDEAILLLDGGRSLVQRAREVVEARRKAAAEAAAWDALAELVEGDPERGLAMAERVVTGRLPGALQHELADAAARVRAALEENRRVARFEAALASDDPFRARKLAADRLAVGEDRGWRRRLAAVEARLLEVVPSRVVAPWNDYAEDTALPIPQLSADACLEADGRHAWLTEVHGTWLFLRRFEVATSRVVSVTVVRGLVTMVTPRTAILGETTVVAGKGCRFAAFKVDAAGGLREIVGCGAINEQVRGAEYTDPGRDPAVRIVFKEWGANQASVAHRVFEASRAAVSGFTFKPLSAFGVRLPGLGDGMLLHKTNGQIVFVDAENRTSEPLGFAIRIDAVAPRPSGEGLVVAGAFPPGDGDEVAIAVVRPGERQPVLRAPIRDRAQGSAPIATSRATGCIFLIDVHLAEPRIVAFNNDLDHEWTVSGVGIVHLLCDADDQHVAALVATERGLRFLPLGREPPELPADQVAWRVGPFSPAAHGESLGPSSASPDPSGDEPLRAVIALHDRQSAPEAKFRAIDAGVVWRRLELQSLGRAAASARAWEEGPWAQRVHAVTAFIEARIRRSSPSARVEDLEVDGRWTEAELAREEASAREWLTAQDDVVGFVRHHREG